MNTGMYAIATSLESRFLAQETIARNIANSTAVGHRREVPGFFGFGTALFEAQAKSRNDDDLEPQTASGVQFLPPTRSQEEGLLQSTEAPLDFAIRGEGFFVIRTPDGDVLTRDGHFRRASDGKLVTQSGEPVLGGSGEIEIPEGGELVLKEDGTLEVGKSASNKLKIVVPTSYDALTGLTGSRFQYTGSEELKVLEAPRVIQGSLERSNVNLPAEMIAMIENSRATEMATKALQVVDQGVGEAIRIFSS